MTSFEYRGSGGGGSLFAPAFSPYNPSEIYLASDMSQVFHTTNMGASWSQLDFRQIQGSHGPDVQFTNNPQVLYALDYSSIEGSDAVRPSKSVDGGQTWTRLTNDPTSAEANRLYVDFNNPSRVLISDYGHLYASQDGGQTWSLKYTAKSMDGGLWIGGAFFDGNNVYLGTNDGLLVSTNGGQSFALSSVGGIPATQGIQSLAGAKQNGVTRLIVVTNDYADMYVGMETDEVHAYYRGVYSLDVGQANWTLKTSGLPTGSNGADPVFVAMAPNNIDIAYLGGGRQSGVPSVYKTTNGANSWTDVFLTTNNQNIRTGWSGQGGDRSWGYGEYLFGLAVAPTDPNRVVITDFGFAHATTDGGATWDALYVQSQDRNPIGPTPKGKSYHGSGLDNTTSWQVTWADAQHLFVSNSDIQGQISDDGGQSFSFDYTGHTRNSMYRVLVHPQSGVMYGAASSIHDMYKSTRLTDAIIDPGNGAVMFSTNQGNAWQTLHDFNDPVMWVASDPTNPNRLYAAVANSTAGGIWVTNNLSAGSASTWTRLTAPPRTQGHAFNVQVLNDGTLLATFSGRRTSSGAFTNSSGVFVSSDGGQTWLDRSAAAMQFWTKDLTIDPTDPTQNTWYVGVWKAYGSGGPFTGGLYKTTNRGQSWTKIADRDRVTALTISPTNPDEAYFTTEEDGLWYTSNLHAASPTFTQVAAYGFKNPERVFFNPYDPSEVWVTSFGGGLMVGSTGAAPTPGQISLTTTSASPPEGGGFVTFAVTRTGGSQGAVSVQYATADGTALAESDYGAANGTLTWADGDVSTKTITIAIANDSAVESAEAFSLSLSAPTGGATLGNSAATVTIADDDVVTSLRFTQATMSVKETTASATLVVERVGSLAGTVTVRYRTRDLTSATNAALGGSDYVVTSSTLTFGPGEKSKTIAVRLIDDVAVEAREVFGVELYQPTGGAVLTSNAAATVTIVDYDSSFEFAAPLFNVTEGDGKAIVTVRRNGNAASPATVAYRTFGSKAQPPGDYVTTSGTLSFAAGQTTKTFPVSIIDDVFAESAENFGLALGSPTGGAQLGPQTYAKVRIADDDSAAGVVEFGSVSYLAKETAGVLTIVVNRTGSSLGAISVDYSASNVTAVNGVDFTLPPRRLTFASGETSKTISIPIANDKLKEGKETFTILLKNPLGGAGLGPKWKSTVTIADL